MPYYNLDLYNNNQRVLSLSKIKSMSAKRHLSELYPEYDEAIVYDTYHNIVSHAKWDESANKPVIIKSC